MIKEEKKGFTNQRGGVVGGGVKKNLLYWKMAGGDEPKGELCGNSICITSTKKGRGGNWFHDVKSGRKKRGGAECVRIYWAKDKGQNSLH